MKKTWLHGCLVPLLFTVMAGGCGSDNSDTPAPAGSAGSTATGGTGGSAGSTGSGAAGAGEDPDGTKGGSGRWTVMVYMAADDRLDNSIEPEFKEFSQAVAKAPGVLEIIVQIDRNSGNNYANKNIPGLGNFGDTERFQITANGYKRLDTTPLGEKNTGDPTILSDFLKETFSQFPADHYGLIVWNHGGGPSGGIAYDADIGDGSATVDSLSLKELDQALEEGRIDDNGDKPRFEFLGLAACWMSSIEAAFMAQPHASYLIASEELMQVNFFDHSLLGMVADNPDPRDVAIALAESYFNATQNYVSKGASTIAVIDESKVDAIRSSLETFTTSLAPSNPNLTVAVGAARGRAYLTGRLQDGSYDVQKRPYADFGMFLGNLSRTSGPLVNSYVEPLREALNEATIYKKNGSSLTDLTGMSIYFPWNGRLCQNASNCVLADLYNPPRMASWLSFLASYEEGFKHPDIEKKIPQFGAPDGLAVASLEDGFLTISGDMTIDGAGFTATRTLDFGYLDPTTSNVLGLYRTTPTLDTLLLPPRLVGIWGRYMVTVSDGITSEEAFYEPVGGIGGVFDIPIVITSSNQTRAGHLRFAPSDQGGTTTVQFVTLDIDNWATWTNQLTPGEKFQLRRPVWTASLSDEPTWQTGQASFDGTKTVTATLSEVPANYQLAARLAAKGVKGGGAALIYQAPTPGE